MWACVLGHLFAGLGSRAPERTVTGLVVLEPTFICLTVLEETVGCPEDLQEG